MPRAVPDPAGGPPTLYIPPAAGTGGPEDYSWLSGVFILDSVVGFSWTSNVPGNSVGARWWDHTLLPAPGIDREVVPGGGADLGDLTGDGIDDLLIWDGSSEPVQYFILPGPLSQIPQPVLEHPDAIPAPWFPATLTNPIPHCGDLNGDGLEDLCSVAEVHLTPFDGVADWTRPSVYSDRGLTADMNGDGVNELYVISQTSIERFDLSPTGIGPAPGVFEGLDDAWWAMDLDGDGTDRLYTPGPNGIVEITAAGFTANTVDPTPFTFGSPRLMREADFDGDGVLDVYVGTSAGGFIAAQDGSILLHVAPEGGTATGDFGSPVDIGDADGDGRADLVVGGPLIVFFATDLLDCLP